MATSPPLPILQLQRPEEVQARVRLPCTKAKKLIPRYTPSTIRDVVELAPNKTKIVTESGEYVFIFEEKNTLVSPAAEFVKTGVLTLLHNNAPVLHMNMSPPDSDELGTCWVARGVEEFKDGEWVAELSQLHSRLAHWEIEQQNKDDLVKLDDLKGVAEPKERFSKLPAVKAGKKWWFRRMCRRSGT
jgi:hypothetical protein